MVEGRLWDPLLELPPVLNESADIVNAMSSGDGREIDLRRMNKQPINALWKCNASLTPTRSSASALLVPPGLRNRRYEVLLNIQNPESDCSFTLQLGLPTQFKQLGVIVNVITCAPDYQLLSLFVWLSCLIKMVHNRLGGLVASCDSC